MKTSGEPSAIILLDRAPETASAGLSPEAESCGSRRLDEMTTQLRRIALDVTVWIEPADDRIRSNVTASPMRGLGGVLVEVAREWFLIQIYFTKVSMNDA